MKILFRRHTFYFWNS